MKTKLLLLLASFLWTGIAWGQSQQVNGKVLSSIDNEPIIGASVVVKGSSKGTITDLDGTFQIMVDADATLVISYIGYVKQEIPLNGKTSLSVILKEDTEMLDDVIVIGYGSMKKSDLSGSVASVDRESFMKKNPINVAQGLQGAAAGVIVTGTSGKPGAVPTVRVRGVATINGTADPLYVVDGVQVGTDVSYLNPSDIESMEVLKDASATAIYGSAGANGVIMITTKQGSKGRTQLDISANWGIQQAANSLDVLDADGFSQALRIARSADGGTPSGKIFNAEYDGRRKSIDWQDEMSRIALTQQYNISASGGNENTQSLISVSYLDQDGVVVNSNYERITARANVTHKIKDFITMGGDVNYVHERSYGTDGMSVSTSGLTSTNLRYAAALVPTMDYIDDATGAYVSPNIVNPDGTFGTYPQGAAGSQEHINKDNVYALQQQIGSYTRVNRVRANAYLDIKLFKGLSFRTIGSYSHYARDYGEYGIPHVRYNQVNGEWKELRGVGNTEDRDVFILNPAESTNMSLESYFTYHWNNDNHDLTLMAGNTVSKGFGSHTYVRAYDFPTDNIRDISLTNDQTSRWADGGLDLETRAISYYGRATYNLKGRYIFTATVRHDGSSNFGTGKRWDTFPSAAVAWRISEEAFLKNNPVIANLKLRAGWGQTGNSGGPTNLAILQLSTTPTYLFNTPGGASGTYTVGNGMAATNAIDSDLHWETNEQFNVGIDLGLFKGLNITMDYFVRTAKDLLIERSLRPSSGYTSVYTNYGKIRNNGFEFTVDYKKYVNRDFSFGVTLTGSTLKNKIVKMGADMTGQGETVGTDMGWENSSICREGYAVGSYYGYVVDGIFTNRSDIDALNAQAQANGYDAYQYTGTDVGDYKYRDLNGDGHIDASDMTILGNGFPKLNYGLNLSAQYKNFDFSIYFYGVLGSDILSYSAMTLSTMYNSDGAINNILKDRFANAWSEANPHGTETRLTYMDPNWNRRVSSAWVKSGDFLKINNLQIGYNVPEKILRHAKIDAARVYFSIQNLCTISGYNKYGDPEVGSTENLLYNGLDVGRYPYPRIYTLGLNVKF